MPNHLRRSFPWWGAVALSICALPVGAQGPADWVGEYASPIGVRLMLERSPDGAFSGALTIETEGEIAELDVALRASGPRRLVGVFGDGEETYALSVEAGEIPGRIVLSSEGNVFELERTRAANGVAAASANPLARAASPGAQALGTAGRNVVFNGARLDNAALARLEGPAPVIPDGEYWYDKRSGMVGYQGGPTLAYFAPELDFCPPIAANASGGGTYVAVNGRFLHPQDLMGLEYYFGPIKPGRYWLDGQGNYGIENGPALGNLIQQILLMQALAAAPGGQGGAGGVLEGGGEGGSVYRHFANLGASGTGVSVADLGGGDTIVNAGGVMWWPGK